VTLPPTVGLIYQQTFNESLAKYNGNFGIKHIHILMVLILIARLALRKNTYFKGNLNSLHIRGDSCDNLIAAD